MRKVLLVIILVFAAASFLYGYNYVFHFISNSYLGNLKPSPAENRIGISEAPLDKNSRIIGSLGLSRNTSNLDLPGLFKQSQDSVVQITSIRGTESSDSSNRLGSGFVYDTNRHIVTNQHVVSGNNLLDITFSDGTIYRARLIGSDPFTDIAVLYVPKVPTKKLMPLPLGNSTSIRVGEQVAAIGNPFGLSGSLTEGVISGLGRLLPSKANSSSHYSIPDVIQTDAPINPGNSGGPLLNMDGEVIGMTSAIFSNTGEFSGVGLAISSDTMKKVIPLLIVNGTYAHPWLGISGANMTPELATALGLKDPRGFLVIDVIPGSPAANAGIRGGDQIVSINGQQIPLGGDVILRIGDTPVRKIDDVLAYLERYKTIGETTNLVVLRGGQETNVIVKLTARPNSMSQ
ncbi:MAG TPA: trypsin-like peptidase domain-containing protein [Nitrososphaeraceae archaeon]